MIEFQTIKFKKELYTYNSYFHFCEFDFALTASINNAKTLVDILVNRKIKEYEYRVRISKFQQMIDERINLLESFVNKK